MVDLSKLDKLEMCDTMYNIMLPCQRIKPSSIKELDCMAMY